MGNLKGKSRLKLDLLDLTEDGDLALRSTSELTILPEENPLRRTAAVALWRAKNASPQDILRDDTQSIFQFRYEPEGCAIWVTSVCGLTGLKKEV